MGFTVLANRNAANAPGRPALLVAIGMVAMAVGALVYLSDRASPGSGSVFGVLGRWLPSFVHPLAFSLFTVATLRPRQAPRYGVCFAWFLVNAAFEFGQHPLISGPLTTALPLPRWIAAYFLRGSFDIGDIAAAALGALAAAAVLYGIKPAARPPAAPRRG